jgi:hypothetical protein
MKRGFAFILITLFLFNTFGYYIVFNYTRHIVRSEMRSLAKAGYFKESGITLKIANPLLDPGFRRINRNEFAYHGMLYDIISESVSGNIVTFKCINDRKEEKLIAQFHHYLDLTVCQNDKTKANHTSALLRLLITLALVENPPAQPTQYPVESEFFTFCSPLVSVLQPSLFHPPAIS